MEEIEDCVHTVQFWCRDDVDFCSTSEENFNFVVKNRDVSWSTEGNLKLSLQSDDVTEENC